MTYYTWTLTTISLLQVATTGVFTEWFRAIYTQSLGNPVRVGHNIATTALLGKYKTKEYTPCCDQLAKLCI